MGQDTVVERMMIALLTGGHLLLLGVPTTDEFGHADLERVYLEHMRD